MQAMRRYVHKIMAALLCMCLLISYMPLPASAQPTGGASVGEDGPAQMTGPYEAQASTTVSVLTVQELSIVGKTDDFAATREQIAVSGEKYNLNAVAVGQGPLSYEWTRTINGVSDPAFSYTAQDNGTYPLSQHTNTLEDGKVYVYTVQVSNGVKSVSASIKVTVSGSYGVRTETVGDVAVEAEMHWQAVLSASALEATSPTYAALQAQVGGKTMTGAWQVALTGAPEGLAPFNGLATLTLSAGDIPNATEVSIAHMNTSGILSTQTATVQDGAVTFTTATLGAFALAWAKPEAPLHSIVATAGQGGSITPAGEVKVAEGGTAAFFILAGKGYAVERVLVDDQAVEAPGGQYVFSSVQASHSIKVEFRQVAPSAEKHQVTAAVEGGHGKVALNGAEPSENAQLEVEHGSAVSVALIADAGYTVDVVTVDSGNGPAAVPVFGDVYMLGAVEATTHIKVTFKAGVQPPLPLFAVLATASEGGSVTPASSSVPLGGSASFVVVANDGYRLSALTYDGVDVKDSLIGSTVTVENIVADGVLIAEFESIVVVQEFEIMASASSGGTISPSGQVKVLEGESATFAFAADDEHELVRVLVDNQELSADEVADGSYTFKNVSAAHTIRAEFQAVPDEPIVPTYAVVHALAGSGGSISPAGDVRVALGESYTFLLLPNEGYVLDQVLVNNVDKTGTVSNSCLTLDAVNADVDVRATFRAKKEEDPAPEPLPEIHSVFATSTTGGTISPRGTTRVVQEANTTFMFAADEGYRLARLEIDGVATQPTSDTSHTLQKVTADHRVHVVFERLPNVPEPEDPPYSNVDVEVKVSVSAGGTDTLGGMVSPTSVTVPQGQQSEPFYVYPEDGFTLEGVTVNGKRVEVYPVKEQQPASFAMKARAAVFTEPAVELARAYWFVIDEVTADAIIEVTFRPLAGGETLPEEEVTIHRVTASAQWGGRITPSDVVAVPEGLSASLTVLPDAGFELDTLVASMGGAEENVKDRVVNNVLTFDAVTEDIHVRATFKQTPPSPDYVTVHAVAGDGGSISPSGEVHVKRTESQTFTFIPNEGYLLDQVTLDGTPLVIEGNTYELAGLTKDATLQATFRLQTPVDPPKPQPTLFLIDASVSGGHGSISPAGEVRVEQGKAQTFYFLPDEGYAVSALIIDGQQQSYRASSYRMEGVQANHTIAVKFAAAVPPAPKDPVDNVIRSLYQTTNLVKTGDANGVLVLGVLTCAAAATACVLFARRKVEETGRLRRRPGAHDLPKRGNQL